MSAQDDRSEVQPVVRYQPDQFVFDSGDTDAVSKTIRGCNLTLDKLQVVTSNSTNAITYTVTATDDNSATILTFAGISENATTTKNALKATPDFDKTSVIGDVIVTVTPSGDPGASGSTVTVSLVGK